jgi:hypothetical protein
MGMATSRLLGLAIPVLCAAIAAGCGSAQHTQTASSEVAGFTWLNPAPVPAGWQTVRIPSGAAVSYPSGWTRIHGDPGTATVALLGSGDQILGYLNITPRQSAETLANYAHLRVDHNGDEGDSAITTLTAVTKHRFGEGHASCVQDSYATRTGARYVELACLLAGPRASVVVVGAAPPQQWPHVSPLLQRAIATTTT